MNLAKQVVNKMINGDAFSQWLGIEIVELSEGCCKLKMTVRDEMTNGFTTGFTSFVAMGVSGTLLTSTEGTSWNSRNSQTSQTLRQITYGNSTFVAVGNSGSIRFSSDNGISWISSSFPTGLNLYSITYGNSTFVAEGESGIILTSSDNGTSWTSRTSGTSNRLYGVTSDQFAFCYSDPNNPHYYIAKTVDEPGWSEGDSCYTPSGAVTLYGGESCIGGSGLANCISACETAKINCN